MPSCSICGRPNNNDSMEKKITFHRYPKRTVIRKKWIEFRKEYSKQMGMRIPTMRENSFVCSAHFVANSFIFNPKNTMLKPSAVPTLINHYVYKNTSEYTQMKNALMAFFFLEQQYLQTEKNNNGGCSSSTNSNTIQVQVPKVNGAECLELSDCSSPLPSISNHELLENTAREFSVETNVVEDSDTLRKGFLKHGDSALAHESSLKSKESKYLNQCVQDQRKSNGSLNCSTSKLNDHNLINEDTSTLMSENFDEILEQRRKLKKRTIYSELITDADDEILSDIDIEMPMSSNESSLDISNDSIKMSPQGHPSLSENSNEFCVDTYTAIEQNKTKQLQNAVILLSQQLTKYESEENVLKFCNEYLSSDVFEMVKFHMDVKVKINAEIEEDNFEPNCV